MGESTAFLTKPRYKEIRGATPEEDEELGYTESGIITRVDPYKDGGGWSIGYGDSWGCGVRDCGVEPKVGDRFTIYGRFGRPFHGQAINGKVLWYDTVEQEEANNAAQHAEYEAKKLRAFADNLPKMDAEFDALPPAFKRRIQRFRDKSADFRWESESYEMFCCTQAVVLAEWALGDGATPDEAIAKIDAWNDINSKDHDPPYDYKAQMESGPQGWSDGHSGNTHGRSLALAKTWIMGGDL